MYLEKRNPCLNGNGKLRIYVYKLLYTNLLNKNLKNDEVNYVI